MVDPNRAAWLYWAETVLNAIPAPINQANLDSLFNWSVKESGPDVMRWNNPLNTTMPEPGAVNMNSVGVKRYPSVAVGIAATVSTLGNGLYNGICQHFRDSVPHTQWQDVCGELKTWGTGCDWFGMTLKAPADQVKAVSDKLTYGMKVGLAHGLIKAVYQREPSEQELFGLADNIHDDGSNLSDLVQQLSVNIGNDPNGKRWGNQQLRSELDQLEADLSELGNKIKAIEGK